MSKFTLTLKGLMALALGSFALGASADGAFITIDGATAVTTVPTEADNNAVYVIQSQQRGGLYADIDAMQVTHCGTENPSMYHGDIAVSAADEHQQFAIITKNGKKYLYSIAAKGFVTFESTPAFAPDGKAVISATSIANAELTMESVTNDSKTFFSLKIKGYRMNNGSDQDAETFKGVYLFGSVAMNEGNRYNVQKLADVTLSADELNAALSNLESSLTTAKQKAIVRLNSIKEFYHDPSMITNDIILVNQATTEAQINAIVNGVYDSLDGKLVHFTYVPRENEATAKYLGVIGAGDNRIAVLLDEPGARTKWKLTRVDGTYSFKLTNISTDTYLTAKWNTGIVAAGNSGNSTFQVDFTNNTAAQNAVSLRFSTNQISLKIGSQTHGGVVYPYTLVWSASDNNTSVHNNINFAWKITPVGLSETYLSSMEVGVGEYFVIRNNRALTSMPKTEDAPAYPGALLGCYTPDREKARKNATKLDNGVTFSNGVHVRQYMTGMQTIWKIVPQTGGGYKIYSLMGEGENDAPLMGMTFSGEDNSEITITDNPTTVYFLDPTSYNGYDSNKSPLPYGVAISTTPKATEAKCFYLANALEGADGKTGTGDFYVTANSESPATSTATTGQGSVFYIERVSSTDVANAKAAFIDYAKNNRMFELLKNVLTDDEIEYALEQKVSMKPGDINSVAAARAYLNLGSQAASTRAFEMLDGKVIRLRNRLSSVYYLGYNDGGSLFTYNTNVESDLKFLWKVVVTNAPLREIKLKNYLSGNYIAPLAGDANRAVTANQNEEGAGTYNVSRYYSLDGKSFYANLLGVATLSKVNCLTRYEGQHANLVTGSAPSDLGAHWILENAAADDVKNMQLDLTINAKGDLITIKNGENGTLAQTANFPAAYKVYLTPVAELAPAAAGAEQPVQVEIPAANITATADGLEVSLADLNVVPSNYTLDLPVGYLTVNGKLAPALSKEVKVEDTTSIHEVNAAEKSAATAIYDLQGRRVSKASKGVYIINGVKTLVK